LLGLNRIGDRVMDTEHWRNDTGWENGCHRREILQCHSSNTNPALTCLGSKPTGRRLTTKATTR